MWIRYDAYYAYENIDEIDWNDELDFVRYKQLRSYGKSTNRYHQKTSISFSPC